MSQLPAMPVWWADFFNKTDHLTNEEQWTYAKLMAKTWLRNCKWFPDDARDLARMLDMTVERWLKIRPRIAPFFDLTGGVWRQEHLEIVWGNVQERVAISQRNGTKGGRPKSNKNKDIENPAGLQQATQSEPNQSQSQKVEEKGSLSRATKERAKPRQQVPEDWEPSETGRAFAAEHAGWFAERLGDEVGHFRDHHRRNGTLFADIEAAWRTWVRNGTKFQKGNGNGRDRRSPVEKLYAGALGAVDDILARERGDAAHDGVADIPPTLTLLDGGRSGSEPEGANRRLVVGSA